MQDQIVQNPICFNLAIASSLFSSSTVKLRSSVTCWRELPSEGFSTKCINLRSLQSAQGAHHIIIRILSFSSAFAFLATSSQQPCSEILFLRNQVEEGLRDSLQNQYELNSESFLHLATGVKLFCDRLGWDGINYWFCHRSKLEVLQPFPTFSFEDTVLPP